MRNKRALLLLALAVAAIGSSRSPQQVVAQSNLPQATWVDPSTGLMWTGKDNGKDISWRAAMKYCHRLHLNSYSDWRLANMTELQGIYDKAIEAPGLAGPIEKPEPFTWHVKGNLFLTGDEWSGHQVTGRIPLESYEDHFNFNEGKPNKDPSGWPYPSAGMRALCVRSAAK